MVDYGNALKRPFTDLVKLVVGIVLSLVPIINFFAWGFMLECTGFGKSKQKDKMPEWKEWPNLLFKGVTAFIVSIIYLLPAIAVFSLGIGFTVFSLMGSVFGPMMSGDVMGAIMQGQITPGIFRNTFAQNWPLISSILLTAAPIFLVGSLLSLLGFYLIPVALVNYLKKKRVSGAFDLGTVFKKAFTSKYFVVWLASFFIWLIGTWLFSLVPVIGSAAAFFIVGVITFSLFGQVLKELKV